MKNSKPNLQAIKIISALKQNTKKSKLSLETKEIISALKETIENDILFRTTIFYKSADNINKDFLRGFDTALNIVKDCIKSGFEAIYLEHNEII